MIELREIEYQDIPNVQKYASHPAIGQMSYVPSPVGSNAISLALEYAQKIGIENYYSGCLARNVGSQKALLKNGFSIYEQFLLTEGKYKGEQMLLLHKLCA